MAASLGIIYCYGAFSRYSESKSNFTCYFSTKNTSIDKKKKSIQHLREKKLIKRTGTTL